jgi:prophage regulatory protein
VQISATQTRQLLTFANLKELGISFSREHLWRLERAGRFPRRIYLSPQKIAWFESEIVEWLADRSAERLHRKYRAHD